MKNIDQQQVAKALEPEQAKQNLQAAGKAVGTFAVNTGGRVAGAAGNAIKTTSTLAIGIKDAVSGPQTTHVQIHDLIGVSDCASNPAVINRIKDKATVAFSLAFRDVRDYGREREVIQVCQSEEEKAAWYSALSEIRHLAQDAGTDLLVFKKEEEETKKKIADEIRKRRDSRLSKAQEEYKSQTMRQSLEASSPQRDSSPPAAASPGEKEPPLKALTLRERVLGNTTFR